MYKFDIIRLRGNVESYDTSDDMEYLSMNDSVRTCDADIHEKYLHDKAKKLLSSVDCLSYTAFFDSIEKLQAAYERLVKKNHKPAVIEIKP